eukprot:5898453-Prymnesium_polylepis.1
MNSCMPTIANRTCNISRKPNTLETAGSVWTRDEMISLRPEWRAMIRRGRSERRTRSTRREASCGTKSAMKTRVEMSTRDKSKTLNHDFRYACLPLQKPLAIILMVISEPNRMIQNSSSCFRMAASCESASSRGESTATCLLYTSPSPRDAHES